MSYNKFKILINNTGVHTNQNGLQTYLKGDVLHLMEEAKNIGIQECVDTLESLTLVADVTYCKNMIKKLIK